MNAHYEPKTRTLTVTIQLYETPQPSTTGKTLVCASTHGGFPTGITLDGKALIVGLNAYVRA